MSTTYGRARSTEAPMAGIEFTNRTNTIPAWRVDAQNQNTPLKRTHSIANPPPSPFDPKKEHDAQSRPVFGENVRYLFKSPPIAQPSWWSTPTPDTPEVDMRDVEVTPPPPPPQPNFGRRKNEQDNAEEGNENESPERRVISNAAVRRIERARRRGQTLGGLLRSRSNRTRGRSRLGEMEINDEGDESGEDEDEYDEDGSPRKTMMTRKTSNHYTLNMANPAPVKGDTPYILLGYTQFLFNLSLILVFLYLLVQFIFTVQRDVEQRIGEYSMDILQEVTTCAQLYKQNLCDTSPIPAMLHQCAAWETCMGRDPKVVGRAKVSAEMLAEVVNGFVEPISWKTLIFSLSSLAFLTVFVNALLSLYRSRHHPDRQGQHAQQHVQPTPMPHFPPFHTPYGYLPAGASQMPWHPGSEMDTMPRQRRRLENGEAPVANS